MGNCCSRTCAPFASGKCCRKRLKNGVGGELETTVKTLVAKTYVEESLSGGVSKTVFMRYMYPDYPELSDGIFNSIAGTTVYARPSVGFIDKERFALNVETLVHETSPEAQRYRYLSFFVLEGDLLNRERFKAFVTLVYHVSAANRPEKFCPQAERTIDCAVASVFREAEMLSVGRVLEWIELNCPRLVGFLHSYVVNGFMSNDLDVDPKSRRSSTQSFSLPQDSENLGSLMTSQLWILSTTLPDLYTRPFDGIRSQIFSRGSQSSFTVFRRKSLASHSIIGAGSVSPYSLTVPDPFLGHWKPLYDSNQHGCSLNRFSFHVFGYTGPTALVLTCKGGFIFCVCVGVQWRQSDAYWGDSFSHLIQLSPLYCLVDKGAKMIYMNVSIHGHPLGLQVGNNTKSPQLVVNEFFTQLSYRDVWHPLEAIEVWGCGSKNIYESYKISKDRKSTPAADRDSLPDKYLLSLVGPSSTELL